MSDELMELPEGWEWVKLGDILSILSGEAFKKKDYSASGVKLLQIANVSFGKVIWEQQNFLPEEFLSKYPELGLEKGDIVMALNRPILNGLLKIACLKEDDAPAVLYQRVARFNLILNEMREYFFHYTGSPLFLQLIRDNLQGSDQPYINTSTLPTFPIPLPPLSEQKRIVAAIESLRERSQKVRSTLSAIPELCDKLRQSVLTAAFRGDLTADWREQNPDVEPASVLLERIRHDRQNRSIKQKVNLEEIELSSLPEIPDTWDWERLINISGLLGGVTKGRKFNGQATVQVPYLRVANVQDGFLDLEEIKEIEVLPEDINKYRLEHGDILFTEGGDRDKLGRGTVWQGEIEGCIHQNHVYRARLFSSDVLPEYISLTAKTKYAKDYFFHNASQTVNLASINISTLGKLPLPIPPTDEQKEICSRVYKLFEIVEVIESNYYNLFNQFNQIDRSILAKAFRGELVEQDPNDEPASVLLERIRAEREQQAQGKAKKPGKKAVGNKP